MGLKAGRPSGRTLERVQEAKPQLADDDPEKRLNVRMPLSEYRKLKRFAFERDETISDVVREAIREYMSR
ncbi:MAG: hypothetical protein WA970_24510 [Gammaproteobacteria bacterium]|jgi:hypothetical protein